VNNPNILFVDDDPNILAVVKEVLIKSGEFEVFTAESASAAIRILEGDAIDLLITDEGMPEVSGTELLTIVKEAYPNIVRFILTGQKTREVANTAINNNLVDGFFIKPWDNFKMQVSIKKALIKKKVELDNSQIKSEIKIKEGILEKLERDYPGITQKNANDTGSIILDEQG